MKSFRSVFWGLLCLLLLGTPAALAQIITTIAGTGIGGFNSDGVAATNSQLNTPYEVAIDIAGNIYIADYNNTRIRRIGTNGLITTVAGTGVNAFGGDGGPATSARLTKPTGVYVDGGGNIFIADTGNNRVRKVDASTGDIDTIAGTGSGTFGGDGGPATAAQIATPYSVLLDAIGNVYITDSINNRIRKIDAGSGDITTFAGTGTAGFSGDGGPAASADINRPAGMAFDTQGNLFFSDFSNNRVRKIDIAGNITTVAGTGSGTFNGDGIQATNASLAGPRGISVDSLGRIFIADATHHRIRMVDTNGIISTFAGTGVAGFSGDGGPASQAQFDFPSGVQVNTNGDVFVTDQNNHRIRRIIAPVFTTLAGTVRNASTGNGLPGVSISVGTNFVTSDASGNFAITNLAVTTVQIVATNTGFVGLTNALVLTATPTNQFNFAMSPVILGANSFRIVLTWGAQPRDLDSYLLTPVIGGTASEINFFNKGSLLAAPFAQLDVDDVNGFGPETTTITNLFPGTYEFFVNNFSISPAIAGSGAKVDLYSAAGLLTSVTVPATGAGDYWRVFQIDGSSGFVTVLNLLTNNQPGFPTNSSPAIVGQPVSQTGFLSNSINFTVSASGALPLAYQWFYNSNAVAAATNATLALANLQTSQAGNYFVVVTNSFGSVTSALASLTVLTNSQPPPFQWVQAIGAAGNDQSEAVRVDAAGNAYLAGRFTGTITLGGSNLTATGFPDSFVAKIAPNGTCLWARVFGGAAGSTLATGLAVDPAGNVFVSGDQSGTTSFGAASLTSAGSSDLFVAKYDSTGNFQWARGYGGAGADGAHRVAADPAGNVFVFGDFMATGIFGTNIFTSAGASDLVLLKLNATGALLWARQAGGPGNDFNGRVAVDGNGNALITGTFSGTNSFGTNTLVSTGGQDIFVAKYDPNGSVLWARSAGGPGDDFGNEITVDTAGNAFVTGEFNGIAMFGTTNLSGLGGADAFVTKYDPAGNVVHVWHIGTSGDDRGRGVGVDAAGNVYVHGDFTGVLNYGGLLVSSAGGSRDVFVLKTDGIGNPIWLKRAGSAGTDTSGNLAAAPNGDVFLTGFSPSAVSFDNLTFTNAGGSDIYFTKIPAVVGPLPVPPGLVGWWAAEGFAVDYAWTNHGSFSNSATTVTSGKVGSAFSFTGSSSAIVMPTNALASAYTNLTMEAWVFPTSHGNSGSFGKSVISKVDVDGFAMRVNNGILQADVRLTSGNVLVNFGPVLPLNAWSHIAITYDGVRFVGYVNGIAQGTANATGSIRNTANAGTVLVIGHEPQATGVSTTANFAWAGQIDEATVFSRALVPTEIQSIFTADTYGKARPAAPTILVQPPALTVADQGAPVTVGVAAAGYAPLAYQWRVNGTNLPGETNFSLSIPAAYSVHEGAYDVRITQLNSVAVTSTPAVLNVLGQGDARTLFGVTNDVSNFTRVGGGAVPWTLTSTNTIMVVPGSGSIQSTQTFGDFILHAEFRCPSPTDAANGNSGIYLQNRYEIQIFNSFGVSVPGLNDEGAIWGQTPASTNAALPAGQWQAYDIIFHQAQWNRNTKVANARVTVVLNGVTVQNDTVITGSTTGGAAELPTRGPVVLQDNGSSVQFRNVRITPLDTPPEFAWATNTGGTGNAFVRGAARNSAGETFLALGSTGTLNVGGSGFTSAGQNDSFLVKYSPAGAPVLTRQGGGVGDDTGFSVAVDGSGNIFVGGSFQGSGTFSGQNITSAGGGDAFLAKYDPAGNLLWIRSGGGASADAAYSVAVDAAGNAYLAGDFNGSVNFSGFNLVSAGGLDSFIVKYDSAGTIVWAKAIAGAQDGSILSIRTDNAGGVFVCGRFRGTTQFGGISQTNAGNFDAFAARLAASDGTFQWVQTLAGANDDIAEDLAVGPDGSITMTGRFRQTATAGTNTLVAAGIDDMFLVRMDSAGNVLWARQAGGAGDDYGYGVAVDGSGNVLVTGLYGGQSTFNTTVVTNSGAADTFLAKYGPGGEFQWLKAFGNGLNSAGRRLQLDAAGNVYLAAEHIGTLQLDALTVSTTAAQSVYLARLGFTPPVINQQPVGGNLLAGQNATLAVVATGAGSLTYQWRLNGTNITGATNATYTIANVTTNATGSYDVLVTHVFGTAVSSPAVVTVVSGLNPLSFAWARRAGGAAAAGNNNDFGKGLKVDAAGNVYVTGNFSGPADFGATNVTSAGSVDFFLAKYDQAGTLLWVFTAGGAGFDEGLDLALDPAGNPVVAGIFVGPATFGTNLLTGFGGQDAFVAKFTTNGQLSWIQTMGGPGTDNGTGVTVDAAGNVWVTGVFNQTAVFGAGFLTSAGVGDVFVAKYDAVGALQWARQAGGAAGDAGWGLVSDSVGGVFLDGNYDTTAFVSHYDAVGNVLWTVQSTGSGTAGATGLARDGAGNLLIHGSFSGSVAIGTNNLNSVGGSDVFLAKLNASGGFLWARQAGGTGDDDVFSAGRVVVDAFGNVYVSGGVAGDSTFGTTAFTGYGSNDVFVAKYDPAGNFVWVEQAGGSGYDYSRALDVDPLGNIFVTGSFHANALFTPLTLASTGAGDIFIAKLGAIPPVITTQPVAQTVGINQPVTFTVAATGTQPLTYQWRCNGTNLPGATNTAFTIPTVIPGNAGGYSVLVGDALGITASANAALIVDTSGVPFILTPPLTQTVPQGAAVLLTVDAVGAQPLSYQWRRNGTNLAGENLFFLALNNTTTNNGGSYSVLITNVFGAVTSAPAVLTIIQLFPPVITNQPVSLTVLAGSNATFSVAASGTAPFNYQWVRGGNAIPGNDQPTLTITNTTPADTDTYFVQIFNSAGLATSVPVTLTVQVPPVFLSVPQPVAALQGGTTNFSAVASGVPAPAYAWYKDGVRLLSSPNYSGVITTNLLVLGVQAAQAGSYVVVATNVAGAITSAPVTLTVLFAPTITTHPTNVTLTRTNITDVMPVMLSVAANGAPPLLYQWRFNSVDLVGETNTTLTLTNVTRQSNGLYQAVVTNLAGSAASSNALVRVRGSQRVEPPVFTPGAPFRLRFADDDGELASPADLAKIEVQAATNLLGTNTAWVKLTNGFSVVNGMLQFDDPAVTNLVRRYYRVIEK